MTIKEILVLIVTLAGIYANLLFQDSLAAGGEEAVDSERLHAATLQSPESLGLSRVTVYGRVSITDKNRVLDQPVGRAESIMPVRAPAPSSDVADGSDDDCD